MLSFCERNTVVQFILFDMNSFSFSPLNAYKLSQHQTWCPFYRISGVGVMWSSYQLKHVVQCPFLLPCDGAVLTEIVIWIPWKFATNSQTFGEKTVPFDAVCPSVL